MRRSGLLRRLGVVLMLAVTAVAVAGVAHAASPRAAQHDGFGRMVFDWAAPTQLETSKDGDRLRLRFSRPLTGDPRPLLGALPRYVGDLSLSPDGTSLTLLLSRPVRVRSFAMGASWVVDLIDAEPAPGAEAAELAVRTGEHGGFHRLVFEWRRPVPYEVQTGGGRATIRFADAAALDTAALRRSLPDDIRLADVTREGGLHVALEVPDGARVRHFRADGKVVVDVIRARASEKQAPVAVAQPADVPPPPSKPAAAEESEDGAATAAAAAALGATKAEDTAPFQLPDPPLDRLPDAARQPAAPLDPLTKARLRPPQDGVHKAPSFAVTATRAGAGDAPAAAPADEGDEPAALIASPPPPRNRLATVTFEWEKPVAAAVFRRAGWLWIIFDGAQQVDLPALEGLADGKAIRFAEQLPSEELTILRLITEPGVNPTVRRDGLRWLIDLAVQPHRPTTPILPQPRIDGPSPPHLFLPVPEGGPRLRIVDPEVGDEMLVVPLIPVGHGVFPAHDYPEFRLLASAQGLVVIPRAGSLEVTSTREGVDIARSGGLAISTDITAAAGLAKAPPASDILDLRRWRQEDGRDFAARHKALQDAVVAAAPHRRNEARLELARFLSASGFAAEALGVLKRAAAFEPEAVSRPEYLAVRGVANFLMGRYAEALADFEATAPYSGGELAFWKAAARAAQGRPEAQLAPLLQGAAYLADYPPPVKLDLAWLVAEAAIRGGDDEAARTLLDMIAAEELSRQQAMWLKYLEGGHARLTGELEEAKRIWREVEAGPSRKARAHAARDRIELELSLGEISAAQAAAALDGLRFAWRDESFEYDLLHRIGRMQIENGRYSDGLRILKSLVSAYPDNPRNDAVTELMRGTFTGLFLGDENEKLKPVTAIALFNEFRELTPPGPRGDEMIQRLADRLVSVDLLQPAAELLSHQVEFRLAGEEKARVATRLALVELLNRKPDAALAALDRSRTRPMPPDLARQRRHLRARALHELERTEEALALLEQDDSREARLLRAEFLWDREDWAGAARAFATLVEPPAPGAGLGDMNARLVLHWATALTLAGNEPVVERVRRRFAAAMADTAYADAFDLITAPSGDRPLDIASIDTKISLVESFQAFLAGYRERLAAEGLSAMN